MPAASSYRPEHWPLIGHSCSACRCLFRASHIRIMLCTGIHQPRPSTSYQRQRWSLTPEFAPSHWFKTLTHRHDALRKSPWLESSCCWSVIHRWTRCNRETNRRILADRFTFPGLSKLRLISPHFPVQVA